MNVCWNEEYLIFTGKKQMYEQIFTNTEVFISELIHKCIAEETIKAETAFEF